MASTRNIVKVFLASPGGLKEERLAAKSVVDEFNRLWADFFGYHIELVGWEDTVSRFGRPQGLINRDLEQCEYFIGMMWKRWGTPPDKSGPYSSGFEEEFTISLDRREETGRPEISLLFKNVEQDLLNDPGDELKKVLKFQKKIISDKKILFQRYSGIEDFEEKIRHCITRYLQEQQTQHIREQSEVSQVSLSKETLPQPPSETVSDSESALPVEGIKFLRKFTSDTESDSEESQISSVEVARFRLLGSLIRYLGNDELHLGVHDANILFNARDNLVLSNAEVIGLINSGLAYYSSENVPLWYWLVSFDALNRNWLPVSSIVGTTSERVGALLAMQLVSELIPLEGWWGQKEHCLDSWFSEGTPDRVKVSALRYLADCGTTEDLPAIRKEFDRGTYATIREAAEAILRISLRYSRENTIRVLYELQPESISSGLLVSLFEDARSISTKILTEGVAHRSSEVRSKIVMLLTERKALDTNTAERLLSDSDAVVRFEALKSLVDEGRQFSDDEAKKILVKSTSRPGGLFYPLPAPDTKGQACWQEFREYRFAKLTDCRLEEVSQDSSIFDRTAQFVLDSRHFATRGDSLRAAVDDHFKSEFAQKLKKLAVKIGNDHEIIQSTKRLEQDLRKDFTRKGLDIICERGNSQDLSRFRNILKSGFVLRSEVDIAYLQKFGEWQDIPMIVEALPELDIGHRASLLSVPDNRKYRIAAQAIYSIGRERFGELLSLQLPNQMLPCLIVESSDKVFGGLSDGAITAVFFPFRANGGQKGSSAKMRSRAPEVSINPATTPLPFR